MANYLKYSDIPVFANFLSENATPAVSNSVGIFAVTEASLSLDPNLSANRYLGKVQIKNDYSTVGPLEAKFSMTFIPLIEKDTANLNIQKENQLAFFNLTGDFVSGHMIKVSNFMLKKCYLQNYSVKVNAYQPVSVTANFISYDVTEIISSKLEAYTDVITPIAKNTSKPYYESLHAITTNMQDTSNGLNLPLSKINIDINVDCNRTPIYTLGNQTPDSVILNTVERTTNIQGENVGQIVDITGANPGATNIYFLPLSKRGQTASNSNYALKFDINGRITSQQLSVSQNSILNGKVVIKEIIL
jgi:hypothetical protein